MNRTDIEYLDYTWNPTHGCSPISEGCAHCWAKSMSKRLAGMGVEGYDKADPFKVVCNPEKFCEPSKLKKPSRIGVSFMGDLFHEDVPVIFIYHVLSAIIACNALNHTFMMLTKRPDRMQDIINSYLRDDPPGNLWHGISVENNDNLWRIGELLKTQAAVRFVSFEPLLERIHTGNDLRGIDWVICGCESGQNRRPCKIEWIRHLKNQCVDAGVPFFLKQMEQNGKVVKTPELDGKIWDEYPEVV